MRATLLDVLRALIRGRPAAVICPRCGSVDLRPSQRRSLLERLGLQRWRCRACRASFLLRASEARALEEQRSGARPPSHAEETPPRGVDLQALDRDLARIQRTQPGDHRQDGGG